jgi:hypothetical protein
MDFTNGSMQPEQAECWDRSHTHRYAIRVEGHLDSTWSMWFDGMTLSHDASGDTLLIGDVPDQCALHGLLIKVRDLHLTLVSLQRF